jgi:excisionase family DNA binding protein
MSNKKEHMTTGEVASRMGVSIDTVKRMLKRGEFPNAWRTSPLIGHWRIPLQDVLAVEEKQKKQQAI